MKKIGKLLTTSALLLVNFCTPVCAEEMITEDPAPTEDSGHKLMNNID